MKKKTLEEEIERILGSRKSILKTPFSSMLEKRNLLDAYDKAVSQLLNLFSQFGDEVIGENNIEYVIITKRGEKKPRLKYKPTDTYYNPVRNQLRQAQRKKKEELLKEEK